MFLPHELLDGSRPHPCRQGTDTLAMGFPRFCKQVDGSASIDTEKSLARLFLRFNQNQGGEHKGDFLKFIRHCHRLAIVRCCATTVKGDLLGLLVLAISRGLQMRSMDMESSFQRRSRRWGRCKR